MEIFLVAISVLNTALLVIIIFRSGRSGETDTLSAKMVSLQSGIKEDFTLNRSEISAISRDNRTELNNSLKEFRVEVSSIFNGISLQNQKALEQLNKTLEERVGALIEKVEAVNTTHRKEFKENIREFSLELRAKFDDLKGEQKDLTDKTEIRLESIRATVEEKLEKTLSERLGQSFETVGRQLIEVQKGLGEMQTIASDVGGLKKVLGNVKLRGAVGEIQLAMLLEQILAPSQYDSNVCTKAGSQDPVEFAIKFPGKSEDENTFVYLPIDAKFPKDAYEHLITAYENGIPDNIEEATKNMEASIRKMAKDIRDKYIDPPNTTDFAIMFLPFESIYAEVIRRSSLVDQLRDEFKITVAGPTTLVAILNSLQMGFRTLALQKRSSEVWQVLSSVKTEFEKFGGLLEKAQKNIQTGLGQLDDVVGTRTRAIKKQLRNVELLPVAKADAVLPDLLNTDLPDDEETETENNS
jgi:DNA recombination protein RmuC